jgi:hypothetical protein
VITGRSTRACQNLTIWVAAAIVALAVGASPLAQADGFDAVDVALIYHRLTGEPLDINRIAAQSESVSQASGFDRPDMLKDEVARLRAALQGADASREFTIRIDDSISQYDHERGEFSITLFSPGYFVPLQAFDQQYKLVFANADAARAIRMARDPAREFDNSLNAFGRNVVSEIHFRVLGKGDPAGAVTGAHVVRAQIVSARLLDRAGHVVFTPNLDAAPPGTTVPAPVALDLAAVDVAGLRVGVSVAVMDATLTRLFGPVSRTPSGRSMHPRLTTTLETNSTGCFTIPGRRRNPAVGAVCVTALADDDQVVRVVRIERLFSWFDAELYRKALVGKYGAVADARQGAAFALGWGPMVPLASGSQHALTATYDEDEDMMSRSLNAAQNIRVSLQLIDAAWAARP